MSESEKKTYKMRVNVIHDGKPFNKDEECPESLVGEFSRQGVIEEVGFPIKKAVAQEKPAAQAQAKPAANPKPEGKDK